MRIKVGIVGLPNVGKSTLFNALAQKSIAQAENFPFCTIEPNVAPIVVPDTYLTQLGRLAESQKTVPAVMEFVDVAGLVAGASRGEGLGNRFLATIRECHAICHVIRHFPDPNIVHVNGRVRPILDAEVVNLELALADLAHTERRLTKTTCLGEERETLEKLLPELQKGIPARAVCLTASEELSIRSMGLLTVKPVIYVFNVDEVDFIMDKENVQADAERILQTIKYSDLTRDRFAVVSAKLEEAFLDPKTKLEYLQSMGLEGDLDEQLIFNVLPTMVRHLLGLFLVYTGPGVPPERSRTVKAHLCAESNAPSTSQLSGKLHGEIQKGFIRAEVTSATTLLQYPSYDAAKAAGAVRTEGRDAVLEENDVVLIKWK